MNKEQRFLIDMLKKAIEKVYQEKRPLFKFGEKDREGLEQAFVFRTGIYLSQLLCNTEYCVLDLDAEYTKNHGNPKKLESQGIRPDLILHQRNSHDKNKLVVEFKGWWSYNNKKDVHANIQKDIHKLTALTDLKNDYHYCIGVFVNLYEEKACCRYFVDGKEKYFL